MKTSEIIIGAVALFAGYKVLTSQQQQQTTSGNGGGGFSLGGISLGGSGDSGIAGLLSGLLNSGGGLLNSGGGVIPDWLAKAQDVLKTGQDALKTGQDALKAGQDALKTGQGLLATGQSELASAWQAFLDKLKERLPENTGPKENPTNVPDSSTPTRFGVNPPDMTTSSPAIVAGLRNAANGAVGIWLRQSGMSFLSGEHLLRPLPGARMLEKLADPIANLTEKVVVKIGEKVAPKIAAKGGAEIAGRVASRLIPVAGWALGLADIGADFLRLNGMDVTEWLGFSPLVSAGAEIFGKNPSGGNIFENWIKINAPRANDNVLSSDRTTPKTSEIPIPYQINNREATTGAPEQPTMNEKGKSYTGWVPKSLYRYEK